jgi:hypothetical protein
VINPHKVLQKLADVSNEPVTLPANEGERKVSDLVREVLRGREISVTSELQREGLTSIAAMRLMQPKSNHRSRNFLTNFVKKMDPNMTRGISTAHAASLGVFLNMLIRDLIIIPSVCPLISLMISNPL